MLPVDDNEAYHSYLYICRNRIVIVYQINKNCHFADPTHCILTVAILLILWQFNHLSAISEGIPALAWVTIAPKPAPHVRQMKDAAQFYTNVRY